MTDMATVIFTSASFLVNISTFKSETTKLVRNFTKQQPSDAAPHTGRTKASNYTETEV